MSWIKVDRIEKAGDSFVTVFSFSEELAKYFTGKPFICEYQCDITNVPDAICAIPFVCSVLPIIWLTDSKLLIDELDLDFYNSIPEFKNGYIKMYPEAFFKGDVNVKRLINCRRDNQEGSMLFFSGGLDATTSLFRHMNEKPMLLSVWGSDIEFENVSGWNVLKNSLQSVAESYGLPLLTIRSSFRVFDKEYELTHSFSGIMHDDWWHGAKHGIALLGFSSVYAWIFRKRKVYIASSCCDKDHDYTCASDPTIDNYVRFCGAYVFHDGFELSRQDKAQFVANEARNRKLTNVPLHVCWRGTDGRNCSHCEKCYRTIIEFVIAGSEPERFGFQMTKHTLKDIYELIALHYTMDSIVGRNYWVNIQKDIIEKWPELKRTKYGRQFKWLLSYDFVNPERNICRKVQRIKSFIKRVAKRILGV